MLEFLLYWQYYRSVSLLMGRFIAKNEMFKEEVKERMQFVELAVKLTIKIAKKFFMY